MAKDGNLRLHDVEQLHYFGKPHWEYVVIKNKSPGIKFPKYGGCIFIWEPHSHKEDHPLRLIRDEGRGNGFDS